MKVELQINNSASPEARFVGWAPCPCRIRVTDQSGAVTPSVKVEISVVTSVNGGAVGFRKAATGNFSTKVTLDVPVNGASVPFFVAGRFGQPSVNNSAVEVVARASLVPLPAPQVEVGSVKVMVRVRKNANRWAPGERDRLVAAFGQLNNQGAGRFQD